MKINETAPKEQAENDVLTTIKKASNIASLRLFVFGCILMSTLWSVYLIITNPGFLHSALDFKPLGDKDGVKELVGLSDITTGIDDRLTNLSMYLERATTVQKDIELKVVKNTSDLLDSNIRISLKDYTISKDNIDVTITVNYQRFTSGYSELSSNLLFTDTVIFPRSFDSKFTSNKDRLYNLDNDDDVTMVIYNHIKSKDGENSVIFSAYKSKLASEINNIEKLIIDANANLVSTNDEMLAVIKKLKSNEYIYASVVLQKVMITMLIVSIGLYFLRAIGADLLFIRKLTIINLSQTISNHNNGDNVGDSINIYNALASDEEKVGKAPDTIAIKTLSEVTKALSISRKN